jgi:hypothetical protein
MKLIPETHADHIRGVLSCYDRIILQGALPPFCYADGMTSYLYQQKIRIFDYKEQFAQPLRDEIIHNAGQIARDNGLTIEYLKKKSDSKEKRIVNILKQRGEHPGLVYIFSALETCTVYKPWHDKKTHRAYLTTDSSKRLHYYFYFIHVFSHQDYLQGMCDTIVRTAVHTVKPERIATFLGKKLHGNYQDDMGNRFNTRIEGACIRHTQSQ